VEEWLVLKRSIAPPSRTTGLSVVMDFDVIQWTQMRLTKQHVLMIPINAVIIFAVTDGHLLVAFRLGAIFHTPVVVRICTLYRVKV
jgi:hypothetical protein